MGTVMVRVWEEYRWSQARVGGRVFAKADPVELNEADLTAELLESELLVVEFPEEKETAKDAKDAKGEEEVET